MKKVKKKAAKNSKISDTSYTQVLGWSVHGEMTGRLGPLYTNQKGKLFYLDTVGKSGFVPVGPDDKAYIDL